MGKAPGHAHTIGTFLNGRACSDTLYHVLGEAFDQPMRPRPAEERACVPLAGGIVQHGYQCGIVWGSALAAGAEAYRRLGAGSRAEVAAVLAAQRVVESFRGRHGSIDCVDITGIDKSSSTWRMISYFLIKGGSIGCFRMAGRSAPLAFREIEAAFAEQPAELPAAPVSCAALLACRLGASELHQTMAAGLAGGIGLSGGGCGALGAAIWLLVLRKLEAGARKVDFKDPDALALIDRFLKATDYEFECASIAGRKFKSIDDHAAHLRDGGCAKVIAVLVG